MSTPIGVVDPPGEEIIIYVYFGVPHYPGPRAWFLWRKLKGSGVDPLPRATDSAVCAAVNIA